MTGEQVRWGLENLTLDQKKLDALGFAGVHAADLDVVRRPHGLDLGAHPDLGRLEVGDDVRLLQADEQIIKPMVKAAADKYVGREEADPADVGGLPDLSGARPRLRRQDCSLPAPPSEREGRAPLGPLSKRRARRFEESKR